MITDADFGYPAWRGFVSWAFNDPAFRGQFEKDTGLTVPPAPKNALEAMIDAATGATSKTVEAFVLWASEQWGLEDCPPAIQAAARQDSPT